MEILIRKEPNGEIYMDKNNAMYYEVLHMSEPPYNYSKIIINDQYADCEPTDFNSNLTFNSDKYNERKESEKIEALRQRRASECFPIINRGQLWYNTLTDTQKTELENWYNSWLDVTETLKTPTKPNWIK